MFLFCMMLFFIIVPSQNLYFAAGQADGQPPAVERFAPPRRRAPPQHDERPPPLVNIFFHLHFWTRQRDSFFEMEDGVHCVVDLPIPTSIRFQKSVSIHPRTSTSKCAWSLCPAVTGLELVLSYMPSLLQKPLVYKTGLHLWMSSVTASPRGKTLRGED